MTRPEKIALLKATLGALGIEYKTDNEGLGYIEVPTRDEEYEEVNFEFDIDGEVEVWVDNNDCQPTD
ncbi:MAG: hypothetical protein GY906_33640 [bacterium]|nr:hypothetical protein [bacterium]